VSFILHTSLTHILEMPFEELLEWHREARRVTGAR
jgi:hypothetical protein